MTSNSRPNIIMIVLDDVRFDRISAYGCRSGITPCIDDIAKQGALFTQAISTSCWTIPSHGSLLTGLYPSQHGAMSVHPFLEPTVPTLPELLRFQGYVTVGLSNNAWVGKLSGFDRGFNVFRESVTLGRSKPGILLEEAVRGAERRVHTLLDKTNEVETQRSLGPSKPVARHLFRKATEIRTTEATITEAVKQISQVIRERRQPFYLFINLMDAHMPWCPPQEFVRRFLSPDEIASIPLTISAIRFIAGQVDYSETDFKLLGALYDSAVAYSDSQIGRLVSGLGRLGVLDDSLLCVTSDHGENLGEHGLLGHLLCLYDTLLHVPLVLRFPRSVSPGSIVTSQVETRQLFKTILSVAGLPEALEPSGQKRDLVSLTQTPDCPDKPLWAFAEDSEPIINQRLFKRVAPGFADPRLYTSFKCVRSREYKYIWSERTPHEFYDLKNDPGETTNLIQTPETAPSALAEMKAALERWMECLRPVDETAKDELDITETADEEVVERLKAIGYL